MLSPTLRGMGGLPYSTGPNPSFPPPYHNAPSSSTSPWQHIPPYPPPISPFGSDGDLNHRFAPIPRIGADDGLIRSWDFKRPHEYAPVAGPSKRARTSHSLTIWQQPERARLCSYKEENETIDRRPVDPPPVIEVLLADSANDSQYFVRASIVHPEPTSTGEAPTYNQVKTPTGADASAGEVVQTPERLRGVDGRAGQLCVFAKLSVRMPGVFRLKFTLYRNDERGIAEVAHTISDTFEVFSPKLFKGMRESTALTRHLAAQGLKVKLRTDVASSKQSEARVRPTSSPTPQPPLPLPPQLVQPKPLPPTHTFRVPALVWRSPVPDTRSTSPSIASPMPGQSPDWSQPTPAYRPSPEIALPMFHDVTRNPTLSSDLAAFSLDHGRRRNGSSGLTSASSSMSYPFSSTSYTSSTTSMSERSSPLQAIINRGGDDGIPILPPPFPTLPFPTRLAHSALDLPPLRES